MKVRIGFFFLVAVMFFYGRHASALQVGSYAGCNNQPASGQLQLQLVSKNDTTGVVEINGVDVRRPATPFTWIWGDGKTSQGWFPQYHSYPDNHATYTVKVVAHESDHSTDCAEMRVQFRPGPAGTDQTTPLTSGSNRQPEWLGFANGASPFDREGELRQNCGTDFKRVYVPPAAGNRFTDLCGQVGMTCDKVCDWEGHSFPCNAVSLGGHRDGTRIALCTSSASPTKSVPQRNETREFRVGFQPTGVSFDGSNIWVSNNSSNSVTKLRASDGMELGTFSTGSYPVGIVFDGANIWVANSGFNGSGNTVTKLRASDGALLGVFHVGNGPRGVVFDGVNIWVANSGLNDTGNTVTKLRASDGTVLGTFVVGTAPECLMFDGRNIWVTNRGGSSITKLRASTGEMLETFPVGSGPFGIAFDGVNVWVANGGNGVTELSPSGSILRTVSVGNGASGVSFDGTNIWVTSQNSHTVTKLRATDGEVLETYPVRGNPWGVAFDGTHIWVSNFTGGNVWRF